MAVNFPPTASPPYYGSKPSKEFRVLTATFGDGYTQRTPDGLNVEIESWEMQWDTLTKSERDLIVNFLDARMGVEAFSFTMPGEDVAKKWVCRRYNAMPRTHSVYALTATFERVYDL